MTDAADSREEEQSFDDAFTEFASEEKAEEVNEEQEEIENDTEQLKQQIEALRKERDDLDHAYKSQVGRVSALQKKIDTEQQKPEENEDDLIKTVREDYPEIVDPIIKYFEKKYGAINSEIDKRFAPIQEQETARYIQSQASWMDTNHPGWDNVLKTEDFTSWLQQQPEAVQSMSNSIHAKDYDYLMRSFNLTNGSKEKANDITIRRQQKLAANVTIPSKGESKKSVAPDDFEEAWKYYANKR